MVAGLSCRRSDPTTPPGFVSCPFYGSYSFWSIALVSLIALNRPVSDESRARSVSEAFLFQRLESLPETTGLFHLNVKLPIPFDGWSEMEVDLYCSGLKLAIEIDGPQHLADPAAYRRDRRKDSLLQEHGCHVLRFLAEDLSKHLDATLDSIHRAVVHRRRGREGGVADDR